MKQEHEEGQQVAEENQHQNEQVFLLCQKGPWSEHDFNR